MHGVRVFLVLVFCCVFSAVAEPTIAERLGWPEGSKVLMIHADDAGLSHASNQAIFENAAAGTVTSASIMMPCSWVPEFVLYLKKNPDFCAGIHLTYTAEWDNYRWSPVAGRDAVPGLVDEMGFMHDNVPLVVQHSNAEEVEKELRAQIALAEKMGIDISHMDSHMGTLFATPEYFEAYVKVGIEKQIPLLMVGGHGTHLNRENPGRSEQLKPVADKLWASGLPVLDDLSTASYSWKTLDKREELSALIRDLEPGVTWINVHPTLPNEEGKSITNNRELLFGDYLTLNDPAIMALLKEEKVYLTSWRELHARRKASKE